MDAPTEGGSHVAAPLVPPRWAAALAALGSVALVAAQVAPEELRWVAAAVGSVLLYAGTGELRQPEWARGKALVPAALVPTAGALAVAAHGLAEQHGLPLLHLLGGTLAVVAGVAEQPSERGAP